MAAPGSATCPADVSMMSARGSPNADVIMAFDDVNVDLVNVDRVNRSNWVRVQVGSTCQRHWVTDQWVPRVRFNQKRKEERPAVYGLKLGLGRLGSLLSSTWFSSGSTSRLGELGCWVRSSAGRLRMSASWVGSRTWQAGSLAAQLLLLLFSSFFSSSFTG